MALRRTVARMAPAVERRPPVQAQTAVRAAASRAAPHPVQALQQRIGNQATQASLARVTDQASLPTAAGAALARGAASGAARTSVDAAGVAVAAGAAGAAVAAKPEAAHAVALGAKAASAAGSAAVAAKVVSAGGSAAAAAKVVSAAATTAKVTSAGAAAKAMPAGAKVAPAAKSEGAKAEAGKEAAAPSPRQAIGPVTAAVRNRAAASSKHPPSSAAVGSAQAAAIHPATEQARGAATKTVGGMDEAKTEAVRRGEFKAKLKKAIQDATPEPKTESEANRVISQGGSQASSALRGQVGVERDAAAGPMKSASATEAKPDEQPTEPPGTLQVQQPGAPPAPIAVGPVVPAPLPPQRLDYSTDRGPTEQVMAENNVTNEQLQKGNDPVFGPAIEARSSAEKHEATAEAKYRQQESKVQGDAENKAAGALAAGLGGIHAGRVAGLGKVGDKQHGTVAKDQAQRQQITALITGIKDRTKLAVEKILESMDTEASSLFETGLKNAESAYERAFEDAKGGIGTWLTTWGDDWDEHIKQSLATARAEYMRCVDVAIDQVADLVDRKLKEAKDRVAAGRREIDEKVNSLDSNLKQYGEQAREAVSGDFDSMTSLIDERRDALVNKLADQYKDSFERMNAREEELREANKSLWQRVYDATVGLIKKIIAFKDMLLGVLSRAAAVVGDIISDPIGFLGNLVSGVMSGLKNFMSNIGAHLKKGLMDWLFGALAGAGLQLPEAFDLKGILSIVLQILGLTYANFRARAVVIVGEPIVAGLEQAAEVFKIFVAEGAGGLWRFIKEKVSDLKSMVLDAIFDFIKEKVIVAGVTWIIGLLNPASAFFKACKAIYDIVMFFVNRGSQILALVNAVIDSIGAIVKGNIKVAADFVEGALAKAVPVAIGFLASLLGLGDPSKPVKQTIEKAQSPVNKAIDWVIHQAVKLVKAAGKLVKGLFGKKSDTAGAQADTSDPRVMAARSLKDKLSKKTTVEHAEEAVNAVRSDLAPVGLHQLILKKNADGGGYQILGAASDLVSLFELRPRFEGSSVQLAARITLGDSDPMKGISDLGTRYKVPASADREEREEARFATPASRGSKSRGGASIGGKAIIPKPGESHIDVLTWNTGKDENVSGTNASHAERQFINWLTNQDEPWLDRVTKIELHISESPCGNCSDELSRIKSVRGLKAAVRKLIAWQKLHHDTKPKHIADLAKGQWIIEPSSPMPTGSPDKDEREKIMEAEMKPLPPPKVIRRPKP